jgi:hypothetical protein
MRYGGEGWTVASVDISFVEIYEEQSRENQYLKCQPKGKEGNKTRKMRTAITHRA